jgi:hypothetical protein
MLAVDRTTYLKTKYRLRHGYDRRPSGVRPSAIIIHSTNNKRRTSFASEAKYIYESPSISAHYLVGKSAADGVVQFLPDTFRAWYTGEAKKGWGNTETIGIEIHVSVGERPTDWQILALTELVRGLMRDWSIPAEHVETHREIALPPKRKNDPEGWTDEQFYHWRNALFLEADLWAVWGSAYPLPVEQRGWAIPQLWRENAAWLGPAASYEVYIDPNTSIRTFRAGYIIYEKLANAAKVYRRVKELP